MGDGFFLISVSEILIFDSRTKQKLYLCTSKKTKTTALYVQELFQVHSIVCFASPISF